VLIVEWGFYGPDVNETGFDKHLQDSDFSDPRPEVTVECNESTKHKPKLRVVSETFFFNFGLCMPLNREFSGKRARFFGDIDYADDDDYSGSDFRPPLQIDFPILFEFFLLKFTLFSAIFSSSNNNTYNFSSLSLLESIFIRFRSILDKIFISLFKSF